MQFIAFSPSAHAPLLPPFFPASLPASLPLHLCSSITSNHRSASNRIAIEISFSFMVQRLALPSSSPSPPPRPAAAAVFGRWPRLTPNAFAARSPPPPLRSADRNQFTLCY